MKLVTYLEPYYHQERIGFLLEDKVVDLTLAYTLVLADKGLLDAYNLGSTIVPASMIAVLRGGERSTEAIREAGKYVAQNLAANSKLVGPRGEAMVFDLSTVKLKAPVPRPGKIIHTAGNFREHAKEGASASWEFPMPDWISFLKSTSSVIGTNEPIVYPKLTKKLDHEIEIAIIVGKGGRYIPEDKAWSHIAGFTIFNDITARDIQRDEMKNGLLNLGKNLDTFAPMGPCMTLRDDIGDIHNLKIELRVNGEPRQVSSTSRLSVKINEIVSHWSVMTLEPGDIITSGTVSGVAAFRKPDPTPYWLKPGDIIEAEIENIGILRNPVVEDHLSPEQEAWLQRRRSLFAS